MEICLARRVRDLVIALSLMAGLLSIPVLATGAARADSGCPVAAGSYASGAGTAADPWRISTGAQLQRLRDETTNWDDSFILTTNIDMAGCTWTQPIGYTSPYFTGSLDGAGYVISGLSVSVSSSTNTHAGLVGTLSARGIVTRLGFTGNVTATVTSSTSSIVANAGGLVGNADSGSTISYSYATGAIAATASGHVGQEPRAGGLVGNASGATIIGSYATGAATATGIGDRYAGGLIGRAVSGATITRSYATGVPTSGVGGSGGFLGTQSGITATGNFWDTTTSGTSTGVPGGLSGVTGKTTMQLQTLSTYTADSWPIVSGWSAFSPPSTVWGMCAGSTRAFLLWQYASSPCVTSPGPPTIIGVTPGSMSASVAFTADDSGGSVVTRVEFALDDTTTVDDSTTAVSSPVVLSGLAPASTYVVYMRAVNSAGTGAWSAASAPFTTTIPGPPPPPIPASEPRDVTAVAGDRELSVAWLAPATAGSYPISHYRAVASPGGRTCITSVTACTIDGLVNGTVYAVTVSALTGAGWSAASSPSNAVTPAPRPVPSVMITGSRSGERVEVVGQVTGFDMGGQLEPWVRLSGQATFARGSARITVDESGTFSWSRATSKRASIYVATSDGSIRSNTVVIRSG